MSAPPRQRPSVAGPDPAIVLQAADGDRSVAYAAALGTAPGAVAAFTRSPALVWSSYGGRWRQLTIGDPAERSWPGDIGLTIFASLAVPAVLVLLLIGVLVPGAGGMVMVAAAGAIAVTGVLLFARARIGAQRLPRSVEFDGVVLERWTWVQKSDEGADMTCYGVALDDGQQDRAWAFTVELRIYTRLVPGTLVHATVSPRRNKLISAAVTGSPQVPPQVAAAQAAKLPLKARLIHADEAARVLGVTEKQLQCYLLGVSCIWRQAEDRGSITITAGRRALLARHAARHGRPQPRQDGVECWLVGKRSVVLRRDAVVAKIILSGRPAMDRAAALAWLADLAAERLAVAPGDELLSEDEWAPAPEG